MTFGEKLKIARNNAGLKQAELAKQLGTTGNTISNWENNVSKPDLDTLSYICGVLKVKASYFLEAKVPEDEISLTEFNIIKKYRALDEHGKKMFHFTLQNEWERSTQPIEGQIMLSKSDDYDLDIVRDGKIVPYGNFEVPTLKAAHNDHSDEPGEQEKMQSDIASLKRPE